MSRCPAPAGAILPFRSSSRTHSAGEIEGIIFWIHQVVHRLGIAESRAELRTGADRQPDIGGDQDIGATKSIGGNPDDGVRLAVDLKSPANKIVARAHAFPEAVANDDDRNVGVRFAFLGL